MLVSLYRHWKLHCPRIISLVAGSHTSTYRSRASGYMWALSVGTYTWWTSSHSCCLDMSSTGTKPSSCKYRLVSGVTFYEVPLSFVVLETQSYPLSYTSRRLLTRKVECGKCVVVVLASMRILIVMYIYLPNVIRVMKSRRMRWLGYVTCLWEMRNTT
jgi:hypothetical protein